MEMKGKPQDQIYKANPNRFLSDQYPNLVVLPTIHIVPKQMNTIVSFLLLTY